MTDDEQFWECSCGQHVSVQPVGRSGWVTLMHGAAFDPDVDHTMTRVPPDPVMECADQLHPPGHEVTVLASGRRSYLCKCGSFRYDATQVVRAGDGRG